MIEVYKYLNGLSPPIMNEIFVARENTYNLRNFRIFHSKNPRSNKYGLNTLSYRAGQLWLSLPTEIKESSSLPLF